MRVITTSVTVYKFDELNEPAQQSAVEQVCAQLGSWWDASDDDDIRDTMTWTLAEQFGTPGHLDYGVADYPGIPGITIDGWDLGRAQSLILSGTLTRENAPKLPWVDGLDYLEVERYRDYNRYTCVSEDLTADQVDAIGANLVQTVRDAVDTAWRAGEKEADYKTSEERARDWIEDNEPEFTEDGLYDIPVAETLQPPFGPEFSFGEQETLADGTVVYAVSVRHVVATLPDQDDNEPTEPTRHAVGLIWDSRSLGWSASPPAQTWSEAVDKAVRSFPDRQGAAMFLYGFDAAIRWQRAQEVLSALPWRRGNDR